MDELDRRGAFPDRRGNPLDRPVADVARGEHAGEAGLQPERRALERPTRRRLAGSEQVAAGEDVPAVVTLDDAEFPAPTTNTSSPSTARASAPAAP